MSYVLGLDLGQAADYTALAVLEEPVWVGGETVWKSSADLTAEELLLVRHRGGRRPSLMPWPPPLWLRRLKRYDLGTPYPEIVTDVIRQLGGPGAYRRDVTLVVDGTGVGAPVVDMF